MTRKLTRREFLRYLAIGSLSLPILTQMLSENLLAQEPTELQPIIWLQSQSSRINYQGVFGMPDFERLLLRYFNLISLNNLTESFINQGFKTPVLILEGYFTQNETKEKLNFLKKLAADAKAVILIGSEASYSQHKSESFLDLENQILYPSETVFIRLPGMPAHIRHLYATLNHMILYGIPDLDELRRPMMFYSEIICERCEYQGDFDEGNFVEFFGQKEGCLYLLGCKGRTTKNDCSLEKWNETDQWCVGAGSPCIGCSSPGYPDHQGLGLYGQLSTGLPGANSFLLNNMSSIAQGAFAVTLAGVGIHALSRKRNPPTRIQTIYSKDEEESDE